MQNNSLTGTGIQTTIQLAGKTEAGSAEVQPARDNRLIAMDCRWDGGSITVIPFYIHVQFGAFPMPKKTFLPKAGLVSYL
jgi:hypothetical protein